MTLVTVALLYDGKLGFLKKSKGNIVVVKRTRFRTQYSFSIQQGVGYYQVHFDQPTKRVLSSMYGCRAIPTLLFRRRECYYRQLKQVNSHRPQAPAHPLKLPPPLLRVPPLVPQCHKLPCNAHRQMHVSPYSHGRMHTALCAVDRDVIYTVSRCQISLCDSRVVTMTVCKLTSTGESLIPAREQACRAPSDVAALTVRSYGMAFFSVKPFGFRLSCGE